MDCSPPGSSVYGIFQARILVPVLSHFSRVWFFVTLWSVACQAPLSMGFSRQDYWLLLLLSRFSRVWLCDPIDGSPPGPAAIPGILQARILEWAVIPSSRGSSWPRDRTWVSPVSCIGRRILYHCVTWELSSTKCQQWWSWGTVIYTMEIGKLYKCSFFFLNVSLSATNPSN